MSKVVAPSRLRAAVRYVAACTNIPEDLILSDVRMKPVAHARQQVMWFLHAEGYGFSAIGRAFGRDHSTVMFAVERIERDGPISFRVTDDGRAKMIRVLAGVTQAERSLRIKRTRWRHLNPQAAPVPHKVPYDIVLGQAA